MNNLLSMSQYNPCHICNNWTPEKGCDHYESNLKNTYSKYCPNVFLAKCYKEHQKGETITVVTQYGKENECIVFNLIYQKDGFFYYSIVRADGFNVQEWVKRKAERYATASMNAEKKSDIYYNASNRHKDFLSLGEPIKIGHHSEKRHRRIIEQARSNMDKFVEHLHKSEEYEAKAEYWEQRASTINLSMPESIEYFEYEVEKATRKHQGLKDGTIERSHSFSLTYAKKDLNEAQKKLELAKRLWA